LAQISDKKLKKQAPRFDNNKPQKKHKKLENQAYKIMLKKKKKNYTKNSFLQFLFFLKF